MTEPWQQIADCSMAAFEAIEKLQTLLSDYCGPGHEYVQHRDGRPAWCEQCGYTREGIPVNRSFKPGVA
jgi:hypothetical protein